MTTKSVKTLSVHCALGFDEKWPLRCYLAAVKDGIEVKEFYLYVPIPQHERNKLALENLRYLLADKGEVKIVEVSKDPKDLLLNIAKISSVLARSREGMICLSGGMRSLSIAMLLAALSLGLERVGRFKVYLEVEGEPELNAKFPLAKLATFILELTDKNELRRGIVAALMELGEARRVDVRRKLEEMGIRYSKQWVYQTIDDMIKKGLIEVVNKGGRETLRLKLE